ncbi:MAG: diaminopimelate dehydrogenase [Alistipes sp.]|nr:diaminopimelate dehydrogenase [Candidatus Alistipes equi]
MEKIRVAIVGYGNIGKCVLETLSVSSDMELVGIVRRTPSKEGFPELEPYRVVASVNELSKVDVAILCVPSRCVLDEAKKYLSLGINTIDSFDIHSQIPFLRRTLNEVALASGAVSILSAGWDPGSDSVIRTILEVLAPKGITYTNFGPGRSMGHSVVARSVAGVRDALSLTIPLGTGVHRRMVYVELEDNADFSAVESAIKNDSYFRSDETHVIKVDNVAALNDFGHGVKMQRKGVSGKTHNQIFEFGMQINNPSLTAQIMVCAARASLRQISGCYTMIEIPPIDFLSGEKEDIVARLV